MTEFPLVSMERILKNAGAAKISREAKETFSSVLESISKDIAHIAVKYSYNMGKNIINAEMIKLATKEYLQKV